MQFSKVKTSGFTVVELLAGTTIFAIIMSLLLAVLNSFQATEEIDITKHRMEKISSAIKKYYLARETLPVPVANPPVPAPFGKIPTTDLHLPAKYRLDAWGRPMLYFAVFNDAQNGRPGQILIDPISPAHAPSGLTYSAMVELGQANLSAVPFTGHTLLRNIRVDNQLVAVVLISYGPNGLAEYTHTPGTSGPPSTPEIFAVNPGSDDLIYTIDLTPQATQLAETELKKLGEKVRAFDDRYIGKDNDGDGNYDEDGCQAERYPGGTWSPVLHGTDTDQYGNGGDPCSQCPPGRGTPDYLPLHVNSSGQPSDYSCGLPTLDDMKANYWENNPTRGYYYPQIDCYGWNMVGSTTTDNSTTPPTTTTTWTRTPSSGGFLCSTTPPDYYRVPMQFNDPQEASRCLWGLVGNPTPYTLANGAVNNELNNDQVRAAIYCAYGLSPNEIVDPWLNGYIWGCGIGNHQGGGSCPTEYPASDPRYHKFYSAGPDRIVNTADDIIAPL